MFHVVCCKEISSVWKLFSKHSLATILSQEQKFFGKDSMLNRKIIHFIIVLVNIIVPCATYFTLSAFNLVTC